MTVQLIRYADAIVALIGRDLQTGIVGWGNTAPEALRDLAAIEHDRYPLGDLNPPGPKPIRVK